MSSATPTDAEGQLRVARAELKRGLRAGSATRAEAFLAAYPTLAADTDAALELVYTEFLVRQELGQNPNPDEWYARFPHWRQDLEQLFQVHAEICRVEASDPGGGSGSTRPGGVGGGPAPTRVGGYEVLGELGRGGMGVVYKARDPRLNRVVAVKLILAGEHAGAKERERFRLEASAAARLDHPNVVRVFEVSEDAGRPFCVMEFVDGPSLADRLDGGPWPDRAAAALAAALARAAHHAHENGVVHRDIKPANVLLKSDDFGTMNEEFGATRTPGAAAAPPRFAAVNRHSSLTPKLADFGLAKCLVDSDAGPTRTGDVIGTPAYMAPEQAAGRRDIGPAADVWAVGVILYELLVGRTPFCGASTVETLTQVRDQDPVPPRRLRPGLPADLETVCLKCLEKDPGKRYPTAAALAADLDRWDRGEPVAARPVGRVGRLTRWCRRNPKVAALWAAVGVLLAAAIGSGTAAVINLAETRTQARELANRETAARELEATARAQADTIAAQERAARVVEEEGRKKEAAERERERRRVARLETAEGVRRLDDGDYAAAAVLFAAAAADEPDPAAREVQRVRLSAALRAAPRLTMLLPGEPRFGTGGRPTPELFSRPAGAAPTGPPYLLPPDDLPFTPVAVSRDYRTAVTTGADGVGRAWEVGTGRPVPLPRPPGASPFPPPFSPDGRWLLVNEFEGEARILGVADVLTGRRIGPLAGTVNSGVTGFTPDGRRLVVYSATNSSLWDPATATRVAGPWPNDARAHVFAATADSRRVVVCETPGVVRVREASDGRPVGPPVAHPGMARVVAFDLPGTHLATAGGDETVRLWEVETGRQTGTLLARLDQVRALALGPGGRLATGADDGTVRLWDAVTGRPAGPPLFVHSPGTRVALDETGRSVTASWSGRLARTWDYDPEGWVALAGEKWEFAAWRPDGSGIVTAGAGGARLWDAAGRPGHVLGAPKQVVRSAAFSRDGSKVTTCGADGLRVWDAAAGKLFAIYPHPAGSWPGGAAFGPGNRTVATVSVDGMLRCWEVASRRPVGAVVPLRGAGPAAPDLARAVTTAFTATGPWRVVGATKGAVTLYDPETGRAERDVPNPDGVTAAAFDGAGARVAVRTEDGRVRVWDAATGAAIGSLVIDVADIPRRTSLVALSPDGGRAATIDLAHSLRVWDVASGRPLTAARTLASDARCLSFSSDGRFLATGGRDGAAQVWEAATGLPVTPPLAHAKGVRQAAFSPDGTRLLTTTDGGEVRVWDVSADPRATEELAGRAALAANRRLSGDGTLVPLAPAEEAALWLRNRPPSEPPAR